MWRWILSLVIAVAFQWALFGCSYITAHDLVHEGPDTAVSRWCFVAALGPALLLQFFHLPEGSTFATILAFVWFYCLPPLLYSPVIYAIMLWRRCEPHT
jgi:hypothetical protein